MPPRTLTDIGRAAANLSYAEPALRAALAGRLTLFNSPPDRLGPALDQAIRGRSSGNGVVR